MQKNLKEFPELKALLVELKRQLGIPLTCELTYLLSCVLESKLQAYSEAVKKDQSGLMLPRFDCFVGELDHEVPHFGGCTIEEGLDYGEVKGLASIGVEETGSKIYFKKTLPLIGLTDVKAEIRKGVSVADKFATLMVFLSSSFMLTLAGYAVRQEELGELDDHLSFNLETSE